MKILKHGKIIDFACDACGCEWNANRLDIEEVNDKTTSVDNAMRIRFYMHCPECGMSCMREFDRTQWGETDE